MKREPTVIMFAATVCCLMLARTAEAQQSTLLNLHPRIRAAENRRVATVKKATEASICIFSPDGAGGGSGVIIHPSGLALSNFHVVDPCGIHMLCGLSDGSNCDAVVVGIDPVGDLALIQLIGKRKFPFATLGDSDEVRVGQSCFASGNPFLLADDFTPTITWGIISGVNRYQYPAGTLLEYADCLQTDAAINPGNSGGPLFDSNGILIGVNGRGSFEKRGRVNVGVGYAISANQIRNFLGTLKSGRILDHSTLGFVVSTGTDNSVRVNKIAIESDAYRKGIRYDAEILQVAGRKIETVNDVKNVVGTIPPHWTVPVVYRQNDNSREVMIRLKPSHSSQELFDKVSPAKPDKSEKGTNAMPVPESVKNRFESQRGFANYHFQRQQVRKLIQNLREKYNPKKLENVRVKWNGKSRLDSITFAMKDGKSGIQIGNETGTISGELPFENQTSPPRSGGMLNAIHLFHELLFSDRKKLGISFVGTAPWISPLDEKKNKNWNPIEQYSLLRVIRDSTETLVYVNDEAEIVALEYFAFPESQPCVIEFSQIFKLEQDSGSLPKRFLVSYQEKRFVEFELSSASVAPAGGESSKEDLP